MLVPESIFCQLPVNRESWALDFVWDRFGGMAPMALSAWTHQTDGPWHRVTEGGTKMVRHQVVSNGLIKSFFEEHLYE